MRQFIDSSKFLTRFGGLPRFTGYEFKPRRRVIGIRENKYTESVRYYLAFPYVQITIDRARHKVFATMTNKPISSFDEYVYPFPLPNVSYDYFVCLGSNYVLGNDMDILNDFWTKDFIFDIVDWPISTRVLNPLDYYVCDYFINNWKHDFGCDFSYENWQRLSTDDQFGLRPNWAISPTELSEPFLNITKTYTQVIRLSHVTIQ